MVAARMATARWQVFLLVPLFAIAACDSGKKGTARKGPPPPPPEPVISLAEAREGFETTLLREERVGEPAPEPPGMMFELTQYEGPLGMMDAYVSPDPEDGEKHPLVIWLVGGFANSISDIAFERGLRENDQSAATFRKAGILMMYPSLRGGNENPGSIEGLYGEVDDVVAAARHAASLPYVDPDRIYLGGHSTGGTLALLVAESTDLFRAILSLGPVHSVADYGADRVPFDTTDPDEVRLREPEEYLGAITSPTFVFEGDDGNIKSLKRLKRRNNNPLVHIHAVAGHDHFDIIRPLSELFAARIIADTDPTSRIRISPAEIDARMSNHLAPPRPPFPAGPPVEDGIFLEFAVYFLPKPGTDPVAPPATAS